MILPLEKKLVGANGFREGSSWVLSALISIPRLTGPAGFKLCGGGTSKAWGAIWMPLIGQHNSAIHLVRERFLTAAEVFEIFRLKN